ncbi:MAG: acyl-CoA desaturase [Myxococcales bacterium]|nr:acyl-CoA desaturase [Myxococcales bacterium]
MLRAPVPTLPRWSDKAAAGQKCPTRDSRHGRGSLRCTPIQEECTVYYVACVAVFLIAYLVNVTLISVFYHRGLAHSAVVLSPGARRFVATMGNWLTGLDPKGWVCMHRMHHEHSDTELDPHSPRNVGLAGVLFEQLRSYERILIGLARRDRAYTTVVSDLEFRISWLNRNRLWYLPYVVHAAIALVLGVVFGLWILGGAYFFGIMSHPIEGWAVNALGHGVGGRNFNTPDDSRNNQLVGLLVAGEGYQNNHHAHPRSAKFSYRATEFDLGYVLCKILAFAGVLTIDQAHLIGNANAANAIAARASAAAGVGALLHGELEALRPAE